MIEEPRNQETNVAAKGSFADELRDGTAKEHASDQALGGIC